MLLYSQEVIVVEEVKIATWNIENNLLKTKKDIYTINAIFDLILSERVDIIALQNVNLLLAENLELNFFKKSSTYHFIYNFNKLKRFLKINKVKVEINPFITSYNESFGYGIDISNSLKNDQKYIGRLSVYPFLDGISILNTRLINNDSNLNKIQIDEVLNESSKVRDLYSNVDSHKLFVCGDFGYDINNSNIKYLKDKMGKLDLKLVDAYNTTDYLFVPNRCLIEESHVNTSYSDVSSHNPIIAKIKI